MEASVERSICNKCDSEFLFCLHIKPEEIGRVYQTSHEVLKMTGPLKKKVAEQKAEVKA
jgi:hypothetical protein